MDYAPYRGVRRDSAYLDSSGTGPGLGGITQQILPSCLRGFPTMNPECTTCSGYGDPTGSVVLDALTRS